MTGLVPGIHGFGSMKRKGVDVRDKPGHDFWETRRSHGIRIQEHGAAMPVPSWT
jgi:hypothetical protein